MKAPAPEEDTADDASVETREHSWEALGVATPLRPALAVELYTHLPSTNDLALERARRQLPVRPTLIMADRQSAGRGSGGRRWYSGHDGLYLTLLLPRVHAPPEHLSKFALLAGLALCETLETLSLAAAPQVKWPNDVLISGSKVAGILVESCARAGGPQAKPTTRPEASHPAVPMRGGGVACGDEDRARENRSPSVPEAKTVDGASAGSTANALTHKTLPLAIGLGLNLSSPQAAEAPLGALETPAAFLAEHCIREVPPKPWLVGRWLEHFFARLTHIPHDGWQPVIDALNARLWGRGQRVLCAPQPSLLGPSALETRRLLGLDVEGYPYFESASGPARITQGRLVALAR